MKRTSILVGILVSVTILFYGCQKTTTEPQYKVTATVNGQATANEQPAEQMSCPVTGGPVKKNIWTWYNGKKVYFCCEGCKQQFERNPEKYMDKLPQYQK